MIKKVRSIRLTDEEYERYTAFAEAGGLTFTELVTASIEARMNPAVEPEADPKREAPTVTPKPKATNTPSSFGMSGPREFRPISKEKQAGKKK